MANKIKRISINALEKCVKEAAGEPIVIKEWRGLDIYIKCRLSLSEMMTFVDGVVGSCFTKDDAQYIPEVQDFAIRCGVLEMYANFTMPADIEKRYDLVYGCDAYDLILGNIDMNQFNSMMRAIDDKISYLSESNIESVNRHVNELYSSLSALERSLSDAFSGIDNNTISAFVSAISDGKFDEAKLVRAYLDAKDDVGNNSEAAGE